MNALMQHGCNTEIATPTHCTIYFTLAPTIASHVVFGPSSNRCSRQLHPDRDIALNLPARQWTVCRSDSPAADRGK
jgi:hypothetical protein